MWIAKFKLKHDEDIYTPICKKYKVDFFATPYTYYVKNGKLNFLGGGIISGDQANKKKFVAEIKKDKRLKTVEQRHDFIFVHSQYLSSKKIEDEINIFYNPQYLKTKPVHNATDGWEYWEVACLDRSELNKIINAAVKFHHGKLISLKKEKLKTVSNLEFTPILPDKQLAAIKLAYKEGYYNYPRKLTIPKLAKQINKSYSTFQENLRKAEKKLIDFFFKYR
jgi:predicted DNA binding protein